MSAQYHECIRKVHLNLPCTAVLLCEYIRKTNASVKKFLNIDLGPNYNVYDTLWLLLKEFFEKDDLEKRIVESDDKVNKIPNMQRVKSTNCKVNLA